MHIELILSPGKSVDSEQSRKYDSLNAIEHHLSAIFSSFNWSTHRPHNFTQFTKPANRRYYTVPVQEKNKRKYSQLYFYLLYKDKQNEMKSMISISRTSLFYATMRNGLNLKVDERSKLTRI